jgi:argininosuccinate lyase
MTHIRGRFEKPADKAANKYTASIPFDWRLYPYDISGSIAHVMMLARQGIVSADEARTISEGLSRIKLQIEAGEFQFKSDLEDIHMNIEAALIAQIGDVARKLHTARSRNDQVALDVRLFTRHAITDALDSIRGLERALLGLAAAYRGVIMPGYTHMQHAQPVLFAHHLLAYFEMLERDHERFTECLDRTDVMPLGSGALAGLPYDIDREFVAKELSFKKVSRNSMDAVSDRDFVIDYEAAAATCMMHLSRLAQEIALWATSEFGFLEIDDAYATGSSLMPQKKNPDVAELARGKTGRVYGNLVAMLTVMKGLPLAYNLDVQEDKERLFDTVDTLISTLDVFAGMIATLKIKPQKMLDAAQQGYMLATDIADYLVRKGESFRTAHEAVGRLVGSASAKGLPLDKVPLAEYRRFSPLFDEDVFSISLESSIRARDNIGGTSRRRVGRELRAAIKTVGGIRAGE